MWKQESDPKTGVHFVPFKIPQQTEELGSKAPSLAGAQEVPILDSCDETQIKKFSIWTLQQH